MNNTTITNTYWMVWHEGSISTQVKHLTRQSANDEARRLASLYLGDKYCVLKFVGSFKAVNTPFEEETVP